MAVRQAATLTSSQHGRFQRQTERHTDVKEGSQSVETGGSSGGKTGRQLGPLGRRPGGGYEWTARKRQSGRSTDSAAVGQNDKRKNGEIETPTERILFDRASRHPLWTAKGEKQVA